MLNARGWRLKVSREVTEVSGQRRRLRTAEIPVFGDFDAIVTPFRVLCDDHDITYFNPIFTNLRYLASSL